MSPRVGLDTQTVIEAAAALIDELGEDRLSLAALAHRLHVQKPSLYNHISGLPALKYQVILFSKHSLLADLTRAISQKSGTAALFATAETYHAYSKAHPGLCTLAGQYHPTEQDHEMLAADQEMSVLIGTILAPYNLSQDDILNAILGFRSFIEGFIALEMSGGIPPGVDVEQSFHWLVEVFIRGILSQNEKSL